jgi:hypothetical protein
MNNPLIETTEQFTMSNPVIETTGPFSFRWIHTGTWQRGRWCRSRTEALLDWYGRVILAMCNE